MEFSRLEKWMIQGTSWLFGPFRSQYPVTYQFFICSVHFDSAYVSAWYYKFSVIWVFIEGLYIDNHYCIARIPCVCCLSCQFICWPHMYSLHDLGVALNNLIAWGFLKRWTAMLLGLARRSIQGHSFSSRRKDRA